MEKLTKNVQLETIKNVIFKNKCGYINRIYVTENDWLIITQGEREMLVEIDKDILKLTFTDKLTNTVALYEFTNVKELYYKVYQILEEIDKDIELFNLMLDRDLFI